MFLGTFAIDEYVNIPAVTHRFSSGAAYAPTAITYSIYEEGDTTGIDEDVDMTPASPFDSITGLYLARRQLTAAAGFEANKTYLVVVKATVDGVSAIDAHLFQIRPVQSGDSYAIVGSETYGNSAIKTTINALTAEAIRQEMDNNSTKLTAILEDTGTTLPSLIAGGTQGSGTIEYDLPNIYKTGTTTPIADVDVWITTDEAGLNVIASGKTDAYGTCKFYLDAGTVYVWCQKSGYNFTNPTAETVS